MKLFGRPFQIRCSRGLPVYSRDEASYLCTLGGVSAEDAAIRVRFVTGEDIAGHWPSFDIANEAWDEPLREVEQAIQSLRLSETEDLECR